MLGGGLGEDRRASTAHRFWMSVELGYCSWSMMLTAWDSAISFSASGSIQVVCSGSQPVFSCQLWPSVNSQQRGVKGDVWGGILTAHHERCQVEPAYGSNPDLIPTGA